MNIKALALSLTFTAAAGMAMAEPVLGVWKTQPGDDGAYGHVTMRACGNAICGTVTKGFDASGKPTTGGSVGRKIVCPKPSKMAQQTKRLPS